MSYLNDKKYSKSEHFAKLLIDSFPDNIEIPDIGLDEDDDSFDIFWKKKNVLLSAKIENNLLIYAGIFGDERLQGQVIFGYNNMPESFMKLISKHFPKY